jgi:hypothetical protein
MSLATLPSDLPSRDLIRENTHTFATLDVKKETKNLASPFALLQSDLLLSIGEENLLLIAIARAEALARAIDVELDEIVDFVKFACLVIDSDTGHIPSTQFFDKKTPEQTKEPLLGEEVTDTSAWLPLLKQSIHATLRDIAVLLEPILVRAVPAMAELAAAQQALLVFYETGARYALVQRMNSARKLVHGQLGQMVHDHPELGLKVTYPDAHFLHDNRRRKKETPATIDSEIAALKKKIASLEIKREKIVTVLAADQKATTKKRKLTRADEIAKAEREQADVAARLAALKAEQDAEDKQP